MEELIKNFKQEKEEKGMKRKLSDYHRMITIKLLIV